MSVVTVQHDRQLPSGVREKYGEEPDDLIESSTVTKGGVILKDLFSSTYTVIENIGAVPSVCGSGRTSDIRVYGRDYVTSSPDVPRTYGAPLLGTLGKASDRR